MGRWGWLWPGPMKNEVFLKPECVGIPGKPMSSLPAHVLKSKVPKASALPKFSSPTSGLVLLVGSAWGAGAGGWGHLG